ncbi:MAG: hypothetical protein ACREF9_14585, partial [Opitutaceae bacterium]
MPAATIKSQRCSKDSSLDESPLAVKKKTRGEIVANVIDPDRDWHRHDERFNHSENWSGGA